MMMLHFRYLEDLRLLCLLLQVVQNNKYKMKSVTSKQLLIRTMFLKFRQFMTFTRINSMICKQVTKKKYG